LKVLLRTFLLFSVAGQRPGAGYHTLANNILQFNEINYSPIQIDIAKLDDGNGIAATFITRNAKWHKTCYNKFNDLTLQRAEKRKSFDKPGCSLIYQLSLTEIAQVLNPPISTAAAFSVTTSRVLFTKPRHSTWMQEFENVHLSSRQCIACKT
jgi:hypothetical protein